MLLQKVMNLKYSNDVSLSIKGEMRPNFFVNVALAKIDFGFSRLISLLNQRNGIG